MLIYYIKAQTRSSEVCGVNVKKFKRYRYIFRFLVLLTVTLTAFLFSCSSLDQSGFPKHMGQITFLFFFVMCSYIPGLSQEETTVSSVQLCGVFMDCLSPWAVVGGVFRHFEFIFIRTERSCTVERNSGFALISLVLLRWWSQLEKWIKNEFKDYGSIHKSELNQSQGSNVTGLVNILKVQYSGTLSVT